MSGTICVVEPETSKPSRASSPRSTSAFACSRSTRRGCSSSTSSAASAPATAGGGGAVEKISGRALFVKQLRELGVAGDERAVGAERLAERPDDDVDLALEAGLVRPRRARRRRGSRSRAPRRRRRARRGAARARRSPRAARRRRPSRRPDSVTIERAARAGLLQAPREVLDVVVAVDEDLGPREPAAVDDRGVVELVGEDDLAGARERAHDAEVREVARAEQQRGLGALERGELLLEAAVDGHRARHEARGSGADAPAHRRVGGRLLHARVVGEPEVVVRAQQRTGRPSRTTFGPCGPLTSRVRR